MIAAERLSCVPDPSMIDFNSNPQLKLDVAYRQTYSPMVEQGAAGHLESMSEIDTCVSFIERGNQPAVAYNLYRNQFAEPYLGYWRQVEAFASELEPMHGSIKSTVIIAAEAAEIVPLARSLENYTHQNCDPSTVEILLYVNRKQDSNCTSQAILDKVGMFKEAHSQLAVHIVDDVIANDEQLSTIKKRAVDIAVSRWSMSPQYRDNGYTFILNDADTARLHPDYIASYQQMFGHHILADVAVQTHDLDPEAFRQLGPTFTFGARVRQLIERQHERNAKAFFPEGFDMAIRPAFYCAVGGFIAGMPYGEDYSFGKLLLHYRHGTSSALLLKPERTGIYTSARRPALHYARNLRSGTNSRGDAEIDNLLRSGVYPKIIEEDTLQHNIEAELHRIDDYFADTDIPAGHPIITNTAAYFGVNSENRADRGYVVKDLGAFATAYASGIASMDIA